MALARFHHLTLEAIDPRQASRFWCAALGYAVDESRSTDDLVVLTGDGDGAVVELVRNPDARTVGRRIHVDLHASRLDELLDAGGHVIDEPQPWVVLHCPEHRELGVLLTDDATEERFYQLVLDSPEPEAAAAWWAHLLKTTLRPVSDDPDVAFIEPVPYAPFEAIVFAREAERKSVPNSAWMTITTYDCRALELVGATRLATLPDGTVRMADPDGNEFVAIELSRPAQS